MSNPILVVDDDPQIRLALREAIQRLGYETVLCEGGEQALKRLSQDTFSLLVTDMKMPRMDGLTLLREVRKRSGSLPVLVITGYGTIDNAVETMKEGATDYLVKPFSLESLKKAIQSVMSKTSVERSIVSVNSEMVRVIGLAESLAPTDITVLIQGESGTGKEVIARHVHRMSRRAEGPFIAVNCAAIPDALLESELFGHEKGAFTGAVERRPGRFELADGGTLLLDEISEMSVVLQAKLLRVLQEKEIDRIGAKYPIPIDVRVVATTNKDLRRECAEKRFREDLFYRLNVFPLTVPPLRERPDDILPLSQHFIARYGQLSGKDVRGLTEEALEFLFTRRWSGNVRELENVMQRAVFLCKGAFIDAKDLFFDDGATAEGYCGKIRDMERDLIMKTLKEVNGNKSRAARLLGVSVRTIRNKLHEYGEVASAH